MDSVEEDQVMPEDEDVDNGDNGYGSITMTARHIPDYS